MKPNDPAALMIAAVLVVIAAILASYRPARKAFRIDPTFALRNESARRAVAQARWRLE